MLSTATLCLLYKLYAVRLYSKDVKDVKAANKKFVSRVSAMRVHRDILTRRSWECDPLLHFEITQHQVRGQKGLALVLLLVSNNHAGDQEGKD